MRKRGSSAAIDGRVEWSFKWIIGAVMLDDGVLVSPSSPSHRAYIDYG